MKNLLWMKPIGTAFNDILSCDMINSIKIVNTHYLNTMRVYLGEFRHWDTSSEEGKIMRGVSKKYNNVESHLLLRP